VRRRPDTGGEYENRLVGSHNNQMLIIGTETRVEHAVGKRHFIDFAYLFNVTECEPAGFLFKADSAAVG
jgi:hypothetical protein